MLSDKVCATVSVTVYLTDWSKTRRNRLRHPQAQQYYYCIIILTLTEGHERGGFGERYTHLLGWYRYLREKFF